MGYLDAKYVLFLNTILSACCSICILIGLWPFQGLLHQWFWKQSFYTWTTHVQMGWFDVGCIGLFVTNLQALILFDRQTSTEAYYMVFVTNAVMHGLWGIHNLHQFVRKFRKQGQGTMLELRRPYPLLMWSTVGACGSAMVRNIYASIVPIDELSTGFIMFTWVWEWLALGCILLDFGYFCVEEHKCKWGENVVSDENIDFQFIISKKQEAPNVTKVDEVSP